MTAHTPIAFEKLGDGWVIEMDGVAPLRIQKSAAAYRIHEFINAAYWHGRNDISRELRELIGAGP